MKDAETAHTHASHPLSSYIAADKVNVTKDELVALRMIYNQPFKTSKYFKHFYRTEVPQKRAAGLERKGLITRCESLDSAQLMMVITPKGLSVIGENEG